MSQDEDVSNLSDEELSNELRDRFGYKPGPITATTRSVYEKKLVKMRKNPPVGQSPSKRLLNGDPGSGTEASPQRKGRKSLPLPSPVRSSYSPDLLPLPDEPASSPGTSDRKVGRRVTLAMTPKSPGSNQRTKPLATYSSDEDEAVSDAGTNDANRIENGVTKDSPARVVTVSATASIRAKPKSRISTPHLPLAARSSPGRASARMSTPFENIAPLSGFSDSELDEDNDLRSTPISTVRQRKRPVVRGVRTVEDVVTRVDSDKSGSSSVSLFSSSYNWVSCSILAISITFFLSVFFYYFINSTYFTEKSSPTSASHTAPDPFDEIISQIRAPLCHEASVSGNLCLMQQDDIKPAVIAIHHIRQLFEAKLLQHFCSDSSSNDLADDPELLTRKQITNAMASKMLKKEDSSEGGEGPSLRSVHKAVQDAFTLLQLNPRFKIQVLPDGDNLKVNAANFPINWPIGCRFRMGITNAIWTLCVVGFVLIISVLFYYLFACQKERRNRKQRLFMELLEKSLELLQSPDEPNSMCVLHIRDTLISPAERKDPNLMKIWDQVVKHIESEESRVKVGLEEIEGETFKTWKWLCSPVNLTETTSNLRTGSIEWQGQAFSEREGLPVRMTSAPASSSETREGSFEAPTAFLKVRNMFDEETVSIANSKNDSYWKTRISNAIIEKCARASPDGRHGVLHVFVDERNAKEGLVYVKMSDLRTASQAYKAMHGWWCEKRLVSVRFLKDERYYSRFPEARQAKTELELEPVVDED